MINIGKKIAFFITLMVTLLSSQSVLASSIESLSWLPLLSANIKKIQPNQACPQNQISDVKVNKTNSLINSSVGKLTWDLDCHATSEKNTVSVTSEHENNKQVQLLLQQLSELPLFELHFKSIYLTSKVMGFDFLSMLSIQKSAAKLVVEMSSDLLSLESTIDMQSKQLSLDATIKLDKLSHYIKLTDDQARFFNNDLKLHYQSDLQHWSIGNFKLDWQGEVSHLFEASSLSMVGQLNLLQEKITFSKLTINAQKIIVPIADNQSWSSSYIKLKNTQPVIFNYRNFELEALPISLRIGNSYLLTSVERGASKRIRIDKQKLPPLYLQLSAQGHQGDLLVDWTSALLNQKLNGNLRVTPKIIALELSKSTINVETLVESAKHYFDDLELVKIKSGVIQLALSAQYNRNDKSLSFNSKLNSDKISGQKDNMLFDGITLNSSLNYVIDASKKVTIINDEQQLNIDNIFVGIPIQAIKLEAQLNAGEPIVQHFKARLLGGRLDLDDFKMHAGSKTILNLSGISLAQIIKYSAYPEVQAKAVLDGMLPLQLTDNGVEIEQGIIFARSPGGYIKVPENTVIKAMGRGNPAFSFTMQLLSNFQFDTLLGNIGYTDDGESDLKVEIKGTNPTVSGAQPINFNYSHNENILKLLQSLRFNDELARDIKERY